MEQQQQSIPQPPQTEARTTQGTEEMEQSIVPEASQPPTESISMSEDPPGSPIINEVEEEDVM